ncbi:MAG: hypothetical protein RIC35_12650 [Marinoscillum sp.]
MNLLILKSDIYTKSRQQLAAKVLNQHPAIAKWTVDREDVDNVLRIVSKRSISERDIQKLIEPLGLHCEDLPE